MLNVILLAGALALAPVGMQGAPAEAADLLGLWLNESGEVAVELEMCGDQLCGRVAWLGEELDASGQERVDVKNRTAELRDRKLKGLTVLAEFVSSDGDDGVWKQGMLYDPDIGSTFIHCTLRVEDDGRLKVRGFEGHMGSRGLVASRFGKTTHWTRVTLAQLAQ
jgi:uncharacterized protein (DUF2147 family)